MRILVLEDEIPAYQKLKGLLTDFFTEEVTHDWSRSIEAGKVFLESSPYDLILSDIQLLDGTSFELFESTAVESPIIFCSAHDEYLFEAFNTNGIAYILKPYSKDDFKKALEKYRSLFKQGSYETLNHSTLKQLQHALHEEQESYKKRFVVKRSKGIQLLTVAEISLVEASGDFCMATDSSGKRHPISQNIGSIATQVSPKKFFRINRSQLVNIDHIQNIENHFKNRLLITLAGCKEKAMTSSATTSEFRKWLEA